MLYFGGGAPCGCLGGRNPIWAPRVFKNWGLSFPRGVIKTNRVPPFPNPKFFKGVLKLNNAPESFPFPWVASPRVNPFKIPLFLELFFSRVWGNQNFFSPGPVFPRYFCLEFWFWVGPPPKKRGGPPGPRGSRVSPNPPFFSAFCPRGGPAGLGWPCSPALPSGTPGERGGPPGLPLSGGGHNPISRRLDGLPPLKGPGRPLSRPNLKNPPFPFSKNSFASKIKNQKGFSVLLKTFLSFVFFFQRGPVLPRLIGVFGDLPFAAVFFVFKRV